MLHVRIIVTIISKVTIFFEVGLPSSVPQKIGISAMWSARVNKELKTILMLVLLLTADSRNLVYILNMVNFV